MKGCSGLRNDLCRLSYCLLLGINFDSIPSRRATHAKSTR
jgi:hypothetical protein